jgi:hypothetical protein
LNLLARDMRRSIVLRALVVASYAVPAESATGQSACVRPAAAPARVQDRAAATVLRDTRNLPCTLRFATTTIALDATGVDSVVDINSVARAPDGRFFTSARQSAAVSVWSADGKFLRNIGAEGRGPGEMSRGTKTIAFDGENRVYVADNTGRTLIFGQRLEYLSQLRPQRIAVTGAYSALLDDGSVITTQIPSSTREHFFHVFRTVSSGGAAPDSLSFVRSFAPLNAGARPSAQRSPVRRLARSAGTTFWAAAPDGAGWGYVLEKWSADGALLQVLERPVSWFARAPGAIQDSRPQPEIEALSEDSTGLLYVSTMTVNANWEKVREFASDPKRRDEVERAIDIRVEIIDPRAGAVLASLGPLRPSEAARTLPQGVFAQSHQGWRREETAMGIPVVRIVEYSLVAK